LAIGRTDGGIRLVALATGREVATLEDPDQDRAVGMTFTPDGTQLVATSNDAHAIHVWQLRAIRAQLASHELDWDEPAFPDAPPATHQAAMRLHWDGQGFIFRGHEEAVRDVAFLPDGERALSGSADGTLRLWDLATGEQLRCFPGHSTIVWAVAVAPNGCQALSADHNGVVRLWDIASGDELLQFQHPGAVWSVKFIPKTSQMITAGNDGAIRVWDLRDSKKPVSAWQAHRGQVRSVAVSADGKRILSGGTDGAVWLWDVASRKRLAGFSGNFGMILSVALSPDGAWAAAGGTGNRIRLWNLLEKNRPVHDLSGHRDNVERVAFAPDSLTLLTASADKTLCLWDVRTGRSGGVLIGHEAGVIAAAFAPNGRRILSGGFDRTLRVWWLAEPPDSASRR
jgi:WD40 repeat protein